MKDGGYYALAPVYDRLNRDIDYAAWADYIVTLFNKYGVCLNDGVRSVCELGCGTGSMTSELARRGYDMTGIDLCEDMLAYARQRCLDDRMNGKILYLEQDMCNFELYGTVDAIVCCLDGFNHLWRKGELRRCLRCCNNYLEDGGLLIFDLNSPYKFENVYADNSYILEDDGAVCCWRNNYNATSHLCDFYLTVFEENDDGTYERSDAVQRERCYSMRSIMRLLDECGFEVTEFAGGLDSHDAKDTDERWYITARRVKKLPLLK